MPVEIDQRVGAQSVLKRRTVLLLEGAVDVVRDCDGAERSDCFRGLSSSSTSSMVTVLLRLLVVCLLAALRLRFLPPGTVFEGKISAT